ncbi:isocitrate/isopropylmalate dehydrogenase family protein [Acidiphilium cryptum]|uniref:3-isopropylmalate dehydrogenase n=1 Tax=Acidiphilium cryptum (strain JF-5) TaxID=349163 RepID=A5FXZ9_ACICJ|nr:isocitrate/isopropylmalate dehydrogenase family protein [Acidiphilium cryptum]ABQ30481.1 3-isopropylmalate dehydrogenase [Acidiphilium cryptum JF-5]
MKIGILNGDDIGHEIVPEAVRVMQAAAARTGLAIEWQDIPIGRAALDSLGSTLPDGTIERLDALDGWLLGPIGHMAYPKIPEAINPHPLLRKHFDLFANIRPVKSHAALPCLHQGVDLVIVRENNEGFQPDRNVVAGSGEFRPTPDVTISVRVITRNGSSKVARAAFELARARRRHLTAVHKDTVFKLGCGMFAEECRRLAAEYPDVTYDEAIVDTFAMRLVMTPQRYDVVVTTNMFGDILTDEAAGLVGGLGMAAGLCAGPRHAMAQATHGSAPDIAGRGIANPYAMIMSGQMLLDWLGRRHAEPAATAAARLIEQAVANMIEERRALTPDLGGQGTTAGMGSAIIEAMTES